MARHRISSAVLRAVLPVRVLDLLEQRPHHGLELAERLAADSGGLEKPAPGTLYPALRHMELDGWIEGAWRRGSAAPRRVYSLTLAGLHAREELRAKLIVELRQAEVVLQRHRSLILAPGAAVRASRPRSHPV